MSLPGCHVASRAGFLTLFIAQAVFSLGKFQPADAPCTGEIGAINVQWQTLEAQGEKLGLLYRGADSVERARMDTFVATIESRRASVSAAIDSVRVRGSDSGCIDCAAERCRESLGALRHIRAVLKRQASRAQAFAASVDHEYTARKAAQEQVAVTDFVLERAQRSGALAAGARDDLQRTLHLQEKARKKLMERQFGSALKLTMGARKKIHFAETRSNSDESNF